MGNAQAGIKENLVEKNLAEIRKRNARVEADKAWEISMSRRALIAGFTYLAIAVFLVSINAPSPWINALVPAGAYLLSTLTLPFAKKLWLEWAYNR